ncbi:MAG: nucleotidyltransferase domain-containing protein [Firmicutes bacterium]|nr:nucleotidyltransferase domain-containing protein [Bacillota bacterium]
MTFGLSENAIKIVHQILRRHPEVEQAILYGSRAQGTYRAGSDIDLTLVGDRLTHEILLSIAQELDESPLPYTVDLSLFADIQDADVRDHIRRRGQVFYSKTDPAPGGEPAAGPKAARAPTSRAPLT